MKTLFAIALTLTSVSAFAQYQPGTKGNPYPNAQVISVQPGTSTFVQAMVPTQVFCDPGMGIPQIPMPQTPGKTVMFYHSDDCSTGFLTSVTLSGNIQMDEPTCRSKIPAANGNNVWGVKVNGRCINIQDMDFLNACIGQI
jgi:hypothetical protein